MKDRVDNRNVIRWSSALGILAWAAAIGWSATQDEPVPHVKRDASSEKVVAPANVPVRSDHGGLSQPGVRKVWMEVTAYCACPRCCGPAAKGLTASGKHVSYNGGRFVASPLPFGTRLIVPGYGGGEPVEVIDRGGAIKGNRLDVYFPSHEQAKEWGRRWIEVTILQTGSELLR